MRPYASFTTSASDTTNADGTYELRHIKAGTYEATVHSDLGLAPERGWSVEVAGGATVVKDLTPEFSWVDLA